jgi:hypothetical protein
MQSLSNIVTAPQRATRQAECDKHGPYESQQYTAKIWSNCPECIKAADAAAKAKAEKLEREQEQRRWEARLERSCIPVRFLDRTLNVGAFHDASNNGLQLANSGAVSRVVAGVDADDDRLVGVDKDVAAVFDNGLAAARRHGRFDAQLGKSPGH